jgi:hypothetical protein
MNSDVANAPRIDDAAGTVTYEQPLAERMRTFLRLEFLAQQANHHSLQASTWSSRAAIGSLLEILTILGRGDIRSEVLKELERQVSQLAPFRSRPGVWTRCSTGCRNCARNCRLPARTTCRTSRPRNS